MAINGTHGIKQIQRVLATITDPNTTANVTISAVNTQKSNLQILGYSATVDPDIPTRCYAELTSSTNVRITRAGTQTSAQADVTIQVTEYF